MAHKPQAIKIRVKVLPRGAKNQILGIENGNLKVKVTAPPVQGKANKALKEFLAKKLKLSKRCIDIVAGESSRIKTLEIKGVTQEDFYRLLLVGPDTR